MVPNSAPEAAFLRTSVRLWTVIAVCSAVIGNVLAWRFTDCSSNLLGSITLSVGFVFFSLVMCRGTSRWLLHEPKANAILLAFTIPIGAVAPLSLGGIALFHMQYLDKVETQMCGVSFTVGVCYVGALVWGIAVRHRRRLVQRQTTESDSSH